jgi:hypothetical protein
MRGLKSEITSGEWKSGLMTSFNGHCVGVTMYPSVDPSDQIELLRQEYREDTSFGFREEADSLVIETIPHDILHFILDETTCNATLTALLNYT